MIRKFTNDSAVKSLRQAIRLEMVREYKKRDEEVKQLVLSKLLHDCRIEIIPSRREKDVLLAKKNTDEK